ncbi:protein kinase [uncultured Arthrobacter sp.]|uniref:protein kinase domain-containing protein n=1 Tax=uncultured Arthrobacter sp. TaxID=114050 RepID=UPI00321747ED
MTSRADLIDQLITALPPEYSIEKKVSGSNSIWEPVGEGGSSMVFKSKYRGTLTRAIKFIVPRDDLSSSVDHDKFIASFRNEVIQLSQLRHENIVSISDFADITLEDGKTYPYMATEFVVGRDLLEFATGEDTSGSDILESVTQLLEALSYMHSRGVMHADIKPENVLVTERIFGNERQIITTIVDLGSSKYFPAEPPSAENREKIYFYTTTDYVHPALKLVVANWTNNVIFKSELRRHFPYQDLHSLSVIISKLLSNSAIVEKLAESIDAPQIMGLKYISDNLHGAQSSGKYRSASQVLQAFRQLIDSKMAPLGVPELSPILPSGVVIPFRNTRVATTSRVDRITSHPVFQRLHHLPQLDLLHYVLPGASNTRFVHALHGYELTRSALTNLLSDWRFRIAASPKDIEVALFSSAVSSLGHYHFLHMFEDFIIDEKHNALIKSAGLVNDGALLDRIMGLSDISTGSRIAGMKDGSGATLKEIFESTVPASWAEIRERQSKPRTPLEGLLSGLHAGPVDVDKLAYLSGDSVATGLPFGRAIEPAAIFESLVLPHHDDWTTFGSSILVGVKEKAISYLEMGVLTRYWSIQTAYWHRTNRALQAMLKYQIGELLKAEELPFDDYLTDTFHLSGQEALSWINARFEKMQIGKASSDRSVNPMAAIHQSQRAIYKRLVTISGDSRLQSRSPDRRVFQQLRRMSAFDDSTVTDLIRDALQQVHPGLNVRPGEVLLDIPRPNREEAGGQILVYTDDGREAIGDLFKISPFLEKQRESFELHVKRMRVFIHPRLHQTLSEAGNLDRAYSAALAVLRDEYARD